MLNSNKTRDCFDFEDCNNFRYEPEPYLAAYLVKNLTNSSFEGREVCAVLAYLICSVMLSFKPSCLSQASDCMK